MNRTLNQSEITAVYEGSFGGGGGASNPPVISAINCTSCGTQGDTSAPYTTVDTTPTFTFTTDVAADCRIDDDYLNYTSMGVTRNCTSGDGTTSHTCTLTSQDELISSTDYVHLSCRGTSNGLENVTAPLEIDLTSLNITLGDAIERGINQSTIYPATIYSNQLVYLRHVNGTQIQATVDKVAVKGAQRWLFNVAINNEPMARLVNITPTIYVYDVANVSSMTVTSQVSALINTTKI